MVEGNRKGEPGSSEGLNSRENIIKAKEDKACLAALNATMIETTRMAIENIAHREVMAIYPIEAEALAPPLDGNRNDTPTPVEWMLWYVSTKKRQAVATYFRSATR